MMLSPSPIPFEKPELKGWNTRSSSSGVIPTPRSSNTTSPAPSGVPRAVIVNSPPSGMARMAFWARFQKTCLSRSALPRMGMEGISAFRVTRYFARISGLFFRSVTESPRSGTRSSGSRE